MSDMGLWQEIMLLIAALGWWQTALILIATILLAIVISISVIYLIIRFVFKRRVTFLNTLYLLLSKRVKVSTPSDLAQRIFTTSAPQEIHEPAKFPVPELLVEIENNLKNATEFAGDTPLSLKSDVWDTHRHSLRQLPVDLREQLVHVYSSIQLLNVIVRLSTKQEHQSSFLNKLYSERLPTIVERLQMIKENIIDRQYAD